MVEEPGRLPPFQPGEDVRGRRLFRNTLVNGASTLAMLLITLLVFPMIIRHLGAVAYGLWVLAGAFSLSNGFMSVADLGLQKSLAKYVAEGESSPRSSPGSISVLASSVLAAFMVLGVAGFTVLALFAIPAPHLFGIPDEFASALQGLFLLMGVELAFGLPALAYVGLLEGWQRYGLLRIADLVRLGLYATLAVAIVAGGLGVVAYGSAIVVASLAGALTTVVIARRVAPEVRLRPTMVSLQALRRVGRFGGWLLLSKVNGAVWRQMDKVILAAVLATTSLTGYAIANQIQLGAATILAFTSSAVLPAASRLAALEDEDALRQLLLRGTRYTMALSLPVVLGAIVLARPLIVHWIGPEYAAYAFATQLFLSYQLFVSAASVALTMLVGIGYVRRTTVYAAFATGGNLLLSLLLVRPFGVNGVIAATLAGFAVTTPLYLRLALRVTGQSARQFVGGVVLPLLPWAILYAAAVAVTYRLLNPTHLATVVATCLPAFLFYSVGVLRFATPPAERAALATYLGLRRRHASGT